MSLLELKNVSKQFHDGNSFIHVLDKVNFTVNEGDMVAIIGPSGSGKSTLLNIAGLILKPDEGEIIIEGNNANTLNDKEKCQIRNKVFGYIFQDFALIEDQTAMDNILVPTLYSKEKKSKAEYKKEILNIAKILNIEDKLNTKVKKLSGGERQRVAILRSIINNQKIILADEPTGSLDPNNSQLIVNYLKDIADKQNKTVIIVTHDMNVAKSCHKIYNLSNRKIQVLNSLESLILE